MNAATQLSRPTVYGAQLIALAAAVGLIISIINYFMPHGTIAHTWGALLILVSTALMLWASGWIGFGTMPHWLLILFEVLIILDILGTGVCAYFLEAPALLILMVVALIGWVWHLASDNPRISVS